MNQEKILKKIIQAYRNIISSRYQFQSIKEKYELPASITEETVDELRYYFLNYIYPEHQKREELNAAFESLDGYIKHPHKLVGILKDAFKLMFKYGRHLPKILSAGLDAMKTFQAATNFENNLVNEAIKNQIIAPYDNTKIDVLIKQLSRKEIDEFIEISESLFELLHDRVLIKKIKEVIQYLIDVMRKNTHTYSLTQIKGLELGLEMLTEGDKLFTQLSKEDQLELVKVITKIENDNLDRIFHI